MSQDSARELLNRCALPGDDAAWSEFVRRFEPDLRRGICRTFIRYQSGSIRWRQEDLVQECYFKLLEGGRRRLLGCRSGDEPAIRTYLTRLAENVAVDALRAKSASKRGRNLRAEPPCDGPTLEESVAAAALSAEEQAIFRQESRTFLRRCRRAAGKHEVARNFRILILAFVEGLTSEEISERMNGALAPGSIDSVVSRARRRLAREGVCLAKRRDLVRNRRCRNAVAAGPIP